MVLGTPRYMPVLTPDSVGPRQLGCFQSINQGGFQRQSVWCCWTQWTMGYLLFSGNRTSPAKKCTNFLRKNLHVGVAVRGEWRQSEALSADAGSLEP